MLHTRYSVLNFEPDAQDLAFMLKEAEKDLWGFLRGDGRDHIKEVIEMLLQYEQQEHLELKRYERSGTRKGSRGGYSSITLKTSRGMITIERPRLRKQTYKSKVLPLYTKNESQLLDLIINQPHREDFQGISAQDRCNGQSYAEYEQLRKDLLRNNRVP